MQSHHLITALLLALTALFVIGYLVKAILLPLLPNLATLNKLRATAKLKLRDKQLKDIDTFLANKQFKVAINALHSAFIFEHAQSTKDLEEVQRYNFTLLSKMISLSEASAQHIGNIEILEELLSSRFLLQRNYIDILEAREASKKRKAQEQKEIPAWAVNEFQRKLDEVLDKLKTNRNSLDSQLKLAVISIENGDNKDSVIYN